MRIRFLINAVPASGGRPYPASLLSVIFRHATPRAEAVAEARAAFKRYFDRDAHDIPGVYIDAN